MLKFFRTVLTILLVGALAAGALAGWIWHELQTPRQHTATAQTVQIARGEHLDTILRKLQTQGVIAHVLPLRIYMKLKRQEMIVQAGNYSFPTPITPLQVLERLQQGGDFERLTIIEGWTLWDIADAMVKVPALKLSDRQQAMALLNNASLIVDTDPLARNLEGYLFPDTYFVVSNSTAGEIVRQSVKKFRAIWKERLAAPAAARKLTPHQVVTIASIIETEAKLKSERPLVASVIYNRLRRGMPLSMDSTIVYASKLAGAWRNDGKVYMSDVQRRSPYNTRIFAGLPPGPVGCPGVSSLEAAVNPANTSYLFYVRDPDRNDGAHTFYADAEGFEVGVQKLRAWEARQKAAN